MRDVLSQQTGPCVRTSAGASELAGRKKQRPRSSAATASVVRLELLNARQCPARRPLPAVYSGHASCAPPALLSFAVRSLVDQIDARASLHTLLPCCTFSALLSRYSFLSYIAQVPYLGPSPDDLCSGALPTPRAVNLSLVSSICPDSPPFHTCYRVGRGNEFCIR